MLSKQQSSQSRLIASAGCEAADKHLDFFKSAFEVKQFPKHWSFSKIPDVEVECWVTELRWTKLRCVRATHTYCGLKQPGQQQQKEGWCPHHVRVVLLWVFLWRLGGAELRHPQPLLQSVLFHFSTESASPPPPILPTSPPLLHLISPQTLSSSPCSQPPSVIFTWFLVHGLKDWPCFWQAVVRFRIYIQVIGFYPATSMENRCQDVNRELG